MHYYNIYYKYTPDTINFRFLASDIANELPKGYSPAATNIKAKSKLEALKSHLKPVLPTPNPDTRTNTLQSSF
jgi:hypothetical protein